jgi:hypothetical protein
MYIISKYPPQIQQYSPDYTVISQDIGKNHPNEQESILIYSKIQAKLNPCNSPGSTGYIMHNKTY